MKTAKRYLTDRHGKRRAVIVPLSEYRRMMEDLHDLAVVAEHRRERPISLEEMRAQLRSFGLPWNRR
jgi:PHD/YefM family antitoxin component YafN of YafNO toxin-antitoxin module